MATNLENQFIDESYQKLIQISGSYIADGTGSTIEQLNLDIIGTASYATNAVPWDGQFSGSAAVTGSFTVKDNTGIEITNESGTGAVTIEPGPDFSTKFTPATLTGLTTIGANLLSGSGHMIGKAGDDIIIKNLSSGGGSNIDLGFGLFTGAYTLRLNSASNDAEFRNNVDVAGDVTATNFIGTASLALTASFLEGSVASASFAAFALEAENAEHADAVQFPVIAKETLTKGDPVYVSGYNSGEGKPEVLKADASDSSKMPVVGLAMVNASNNDHIFIAVGGNFSDVDTSTGLTTPAIGDTLYVASGGGYTNVKPTGTNLIQNIGVIGRVQQNTGQIVVSAIQRSNDIPNIAEDHLWLGDSNGVPQATDKDALTVGTASLALDVISTANLNVTSISASNATFTSASVGYLESITGSAKIIGDAFIVLNNDTPTERYAGLAVYDSGSTNNTSSFAYDGQTDDWFFEKDVTGSAHFGVALFGPEYDTKGAPTYITQDRIPKGVGDHHLEDSNISDNGTKIVLGSDSEVTGSLGVTGTISGNLTGNVTGDLTGNADTATTANTASYIDYVNIDHVPALVSSSAQIDVTATTNYVTPVDLTTNQTIGGDKTFTGYATFFDGVQGGISPLSGTGTVTLDISTGTFFATAPSGTVTYAVTGAPMGPGITVSFIIDNSSSQIVNFTGVQWPGGTAPTITAGGKDIITLVAVGGSIYGAAVQNFS